MRRRLAVLLAGGLLVGLGSGAWAQQATGGTTERTVLGPITLQATLDRAAGGAEALAFRIVLDTHSADLSQIALDQQVVLKAGAGEVRPLAWRVTTGGGHHLQGLLTFPAKTGAGVAVLDGSAREAVLVIRGIGGVPERSLKVPVTP
ncbi:MAG: hypothetical protein HYV08_16395 [Deltaproteobacteria bacterium]|nr:hypothetical protein [Deltaproteobacteria bacterium]